MSEIIPQPDWGRPMPHLTDDDVYEIEEDDEDDDDDPNCKLCGHGLLDSHLPGCIESGER